MDGIQQISLAGTIGPADDRDIRVKGKLPFLVILELVNADMLQEQHPRKISVNDG